MAACLQCYYSAIQALQPPAQTTAGTTAECFHTDIATRVSSWSTPWSTHVCIVHGIVCSLGPPCHPMLSTTSPSCHRYLVLQSLHAIFGALHGVQTIHNYQISSLFT